MQTTRHDHGGQRGARDQRTGHRLKQMGRRTVLGGISLTDLRIESTSRAFIDRLLVVRGTGFCHQ
jgi:hypothetical protein